MPAPQTLKNVRKLSCKGELFCCSGCRAAYGFRELYQVLLWERYLRKLLILNDMTIKKQLCQCDKVALF